MFCERNLRESYPTEDCRLRRLSFKISRLYFLVIFLVIKGIPGQTSSIRGNILTEDLTPVRYASVTFINQNDTTQRFSTITDTTGYYQLSVTTAIDHLDFNLPSTIELSQNYPNPFSGSTSIHYQIAKSAEVSIKIYNLLGQEVRELKAAPHIAGIYGLIWDGRDNRGKRVAPGVYFYQLRAGNEIKVKKMLYGLCGTNGYIGNNFNSMNSMAISFRPMELNKENKLSVNVGTFSVKVENTDRTRPRIISQQFNYVTIRGDTTLDFVVIPQPCPPWEIVPTPPYDSPIWHPSGNFIGFNYTPLEQINYPYQDSCFGEYIWNIDSAGFWSINPDGADKRRIFPYKLTNPAWAPDGQWIAFNSGAQIYVMRSTGTSLDTTTITQLTFEGLNFLPTWSPDGNWISFDSNVDSPNGMYFVWKMKTDGSQKRRLVYETSIGEIRMPNWSPDGKKIVHQRYVGMEGSEIFIMDTSGGSIERLTFDNRFDCYPKFSPDGTKIAFWSNGNLWLMDATGANQYQLTTRDVGIGWGPPFSWSPDGSKIVYYRYRADDWSYANGVLWIYDISSGTEWQLTYNP